MIWSGSLIDPNNKSLIQRFSHLEIPTATYQHLIGITLLIPVCRLLILLLMLTIETRHSPMCQVNIGVYLEVMVEVAH